MEMLYLRREGLVHLPLNGLSCHLVCAHCLKNSKIDELQINDLGKEFTKSHETMDDQHLKQSLEVETIHCITIIRQFHTLVCSSYQRNIFIIL